MRNIFDLFFQNNDTPVGLISLGIRNPRKAGKNIPAYNNFWEIPLFSSPPNIYQNLSKKY